MLAVLEQLTRTQPGHERDVLNGLCGEMRDSDDNNNRLMVSEKNKAKIYTISTLSNSMLNCRFLSRGILHVVGDKRSMRCTGFAHVAPWPLELTCWM